MIRPPLRHPKLSAAALRSNASRGFTLIELIVVLIIIGVIAAIAVPRYLALGHDARVAAVQSLVGTIRSTAINVHAACAASPTCDLNNGGMDAMIGGRSAAVNFGWLNAGDNLNNNQIDAWINHAGFTASLPSIYTTRFALDAAPDPANCSVTYGEWATSYDHSYTLQVTATGC